ncbi:sigma-54 dependent transcriptional regulator [Danxiaibacter flavus]|uniref:Sigma-54 dependent transcriptional regulator n=1 Tax=Danxiaibacter flavus TaxID=3049108 RepID=A0ABV3ZJT3_9BACT|nr:sigma-54 dependent transcriptional regulator [Chitinophagaceae bacterium DXS]
MAENQTKKILVIDDDVNVGNILNAFLSQHNYEVSVVYSAKAGIEQCKREQFDYIFCDYRLGGKSGLDVMEMLRPLQTASKIIIITAYAQVNVAVTAIKKGAYDFILKPFQFDEILKVLREPQRNAEGFTYDILSDERPLSTDRTGFWACSSQVMKDIYDEIALIAPTDYTVIIYGESGTGKEMVAREIHRKSTRKDHPFIPLDCGTLSGELAGSELFGHIKGSFTGAVNDKEGHFEMANKGTLFLDEIGNLPPDVQASLLRVIQERKCRRIGSGVQLDVDVRIIVASNENLQSAYQTGKFREDLYHRLNEFKINLPPLRERKEDILSLADYFLAEVNQELNKNIQGFDEEVKRIFISYPWPGNLRELKNVIRRSGLLSNDMHVHKELLPFELTTFATAAIAPEAEVIKLVPQKNAASSDNSGRDLKSFVAKTQKDIILETLGFVNYNKSKAALLLNIDRKTLYNKLREYGLYSKAKKDEN